MHWICRTLLTAGAIAMTFSGFLSTAQPGWTQDFSGTGRTGKVVDGASRGGCPSTPKPLKALIPSTAGNGGWKTQAYPTFWVYIPYVITPERSLEFVFMDETEKVLYQKQLTGIKAKPGLLSLPLPSNQAPALEIGRCYQWSFRVQCDEVEDRPAIVSGWVKRVALTPDLENQLQQISVSERSDLYAQHQLWYDALTTLGEALRVKPSDQQLISRWRTLFRLPSVGIEQFISEPFTQALFGMIAPSTHSASKTVPESLSKVTSTRG